MIARFLGLQLQPKTVAASLNAYVLYQVSVVWSVIFGLVMAFAAVALLYKSYDLGEVHSATVPIEDKGVGIR